MSYQLIKKGAKLPAVGIIQKLLNRTGATLDVDGDFGSKTKTAVQKFQNERGLMPDGDVGKITYPRLVAGEDRMLIVDLVDIFDPDLKDREARDVLKVGGIAISISGMSNGVEQAVHDIVQIVPNGSVFLLRVHGHGASGMAGISEGTGGEGYGHGSSINYANWDYVGPIITRLRPIFGPYGCIEFMHCETGSGPLGRQLLSNIANTVGVPATAALRVQYGGGKSTFTFEGPTYTALPGGRSLKSWCQSIPNFAEMSVP